MLGELWGELFAISSPQFFKIMKKKMNNKDTLEYLKFRFKWHVISCMMDVPILILLWYLNYKTGFWIMLVLSILNEFSFADTYKDLKEKVGLD